MEFRRGGHMWGLHRVLTPKAGLPQEAFGLDVSLPIFDNEILIDVSKLQIDAASFFQLQESGEGKGEKRVADKIMSIVRERGKMHNPVTNSGGVFLGTVAAIGPEHSLKKELVVGDSVVSLVSLTLTPMAIESIQKVDEDKGQIILKGKAIVFESGMVSKIPSDLPEGVVLAALDVCGAPAQIKRTVHEGEKVLIVGLGKAGRVMALQAHKMGALVFGVDAEDESVSWCKDNLKGHFATLDASNAVEVYGWVREITRGTLVDVAVNATPVAGTEMGTVLSCRDGGRVLFFGMQTSFQRVVLGAEGVGKDVMLLMGSGYVPGHAGLMLDLLRENEALRRWFEEKYG